MISVTLSRVRENLRRADVPAQVFAYLADVPDSSFRAALSGRMSFGGPKEAEFYQTSLRCVELVAALGPLNFRDWSALKSLLYSDVKAEDVRVWRKQIFPDREE